VSRFVEVAKVYEEEEEEDLLRCFETTPLSSRANSSSFSQQQGHNKDNNFCS
jgi:hypothetical protein